MLRSWNKKTLIYRIVMSEPASSMMSGVSSGTSQQIQSSSSKFISSSSSSSNSNSTRQEMASYSSKTVTSKTTKTTTQSKSMSNKMSPTISIKSSSTNYSDMIGGRLGIDVDREMEKLMAETTSEMGMLGTGRARQQVLRLMSLEKSDSPNELVKLDTSSMNRFIDDAHNDKLRFNLDVNEFESESINVKTVGNKIEVHAMKRTKKGGHETQEEYSRTYELPSSGDVDPAKVTSSFYKDGVLTLEIPVTAAVGESTKESIEAK